MKFPFLQRARQVKAEYRLVTETLGIPHLLAVTGISSGAIHSVQFAVSYPDFMDGIFPIVGGALWRHQGIFFGSLMVRFIESCHGWNGGNYDENPKACAANALSVLIPYFYTREWWDQYIDTPEAYTKWRNHWGDYYLDVQDARDLYYLLMALGAAGSATRQGFNGDLMRRWARSRRRPCSSISPHDHSFRRSISKLRRKRSRTRASVDRFDRRPPDLLQRRSAGDMGLGRGRSGGFLTGAE